MKPFKQSALLDRSGKAFAFSAKDMTVYAANKTISIHDYAFFAINGKKSYRFCSNTTEDNFKVPKKLSIGVTFGTAGTMIFQKTPKKSIIQPEFAVLILYHNTPAHAADIIVYSQKRNVCTKQRVITTAETSATAELKRKTLASKEFVFNPGQEEINFVDGVYNIKTGKILEHSPDFLFNYVIPANIRNRSLYMPNFLKFVDTLCEGDESKIARLQEFLGVLLSPLQPKNAFFFIGVHDCGKTTLANFIEKLIGEEFVSSVPLDAFDKHFEFSQIFGKRLNVCDELCEEYNSRVWSIFKRLTGMGKVSINRKYQNPLSCHPNVKLLITGNKLPVIPDDSSLHERIQVIFLNHSVPKSERDSTLPQKLWAERDGIVHWALEGLSRFLKKGEKFTSTTDNDVIKRKYITADSLAFFIETYLQYEDEAKTTTDAIFNAYNNFCGENRIPLGKRKSRKALKAAIRSYFPDAVETKIGTLQGFRHLKLT